MTFSLNLSWLWQKRKRMATNRRLVDTEGDDFYVTPEWATEALLGCYSIPTNRTILEPCCGNGAISKVLERRGYSVSSSDIVNRGFGDCIDVRDITLSRGSVVTNPPYNIIDDIFPHLYRLADVELCLLLRTAFLEGGKRHERIFNLTPPTKILTFSERVSMYKNGHKGKLKGGTTCYSWFIWQKPKEQYPSRPILSWIPPGFKPKRKGRV